MAAESSSSYVMLCHLVSRKTYSNVQYGKRICGTRAGVFSPTLAHGTATLKDREKEGKKGRVLLFPCVSVRSTAGTKEVQRARKNEVTTA